jgi:hypothetical protein
VGGGGFLSYWGRRWIGRVRGSERGQGILKVRDFRLFNLIKKRGKKKKKKKKKTDVIFRFFFFFKCELAFFFKLKYDVACHVRYF